MWSVAGYGLSLGLVASAQNVDPRQPRNGPWIVLSAQSQRFFLALPLPNLAHGVTGLAVDLNDLSCSLSLHPKPLTGTHEPCFNV